MHSLQLSPAFATKPQPARQIHRNRASYSCHSCRRRKVKCDQVHPTCGNCTKHNDVCTYNDNSNIKSKKKDKKIKTEPGLEDMHRRSASKSSIDETYGSISTTLPEFTTYATPAYDVTASYPPSFNIPVSDYTTSTAMTAEFDYGYPTVTPTTSDAYAAAGYFYDYTPVTTMPDWLAPGATAASTASSPHLDYAGTPSPNPGSYLSSPHIMADGFSTSEIDLGYYGGYYDEA